MGFFEKLKNGLKKTKEAIFGPLDRLFSSYDKINDEFYEDLEDVMIMSDIGAGTSHSITEALEQRVKEKKIKSAAEAKTELLDIMTEMIGDNPGLKMTTKPSVVLVIGVNGVGKTTSVGKIALNLKNSGKKVMLAAADTFRAAAAEQLTVWADRVGVPIIKQSEGADPAAVVFDAAAAAKKQGVDVLIVDTAGRLHNKKNLIAELAKINRVLERELPGSDKETLLVLDASTGQNALMQAQEFNKAADITGIVLTKLDGTAKGGIVLAVKREMGIPVKYIGVGEQAEDLQPFCAKDFVNALFDNSPESENAEE